MKPIGVLLLPVPEVERLIDPLRCRLDPTRRQDMPAHVTVLVPYLSPQEVGPTERAMLTEIFAGTEPFDYVLETTRWFDRRVLYLAPDPAEPFRRMTTAVTRCFPEWRPYEGAFEDVVPHVTVGEGGRWRKRRLQMAWAAARLRRMAPVRATASEVWLMGFDAGMEKWWHSETFALGATAQNICSGTPLLAPEERQIVAIDAPSGEAGMEQSLGGR